MSRFALSLASHGKIVVMNKQAQAQFVHPVGLGKRQRFAYKPRQPLPRRVVPPLDVRGFSARLATRRVLCGRDDLLIGFPEIGIALRLAIQGRNLLPQLATGGRTARANNEGDDLPGLPTQRHPNPTFAPFFEDK